MNIIQLTAGAGGMFCGGCFRDNALVGTLRQMGHSTLMIPLYLPLTLEEKDESQGTPIFFGGISCYLEQKMPWFAKAPRFLHRWLASPRLLRWAAGNAAKTRAEDLGELTLSMLRGEEGKQAGELEFMIDWIRLNHRPDVICLSNALLIGMARRLKEAFQVPIVCTFQGEDSFLNGLPDPYRERSWNTMAERGRDVDLFIAPSRYYAELMAKPLQIPAAKLRVIFNGINLDGYEMAGTPHPPVLGYFARMCRDKGLDLVVSTFLELKSRPAGSKLQLHVGGGLGPSDEAYVYELKRKLDARGVLGDVHFFPNVSREEKIKFLKNLTVFCTPALYGEAFGLYVVEALASGVPVVQPHVASFPELVESSRGGLTADPEPTALAAAIESLLADPAKARQMGEAGRASAARLFSIEAMAREYVQAYETLAKSTPDIILSAQ